MKNASKIHPTQFYWLLPALLLTTGLVAYSRSMAEATEIKSGPPPWTASVSIGVQQWSALGDLDTGSLGEFESTGYNISDSVHRHWREFAGGDLYFGADLGYMVHDSDITVPGDIDELMADILFLTPSLRWSVNKRRGRRFSVEAGAGIYWSAISEFIETDYGSGWGSRHYEESAPGGYLGLSADLPVFFLGQGWSLNLAGRIHYASFGEVDAFNRKLGSLDGPITTLQFGLTHEW